MASGKTITKTVWQYSRPLPDETMEFLRGIARDYGKIKNYVYNRYSGIGSLDRLTPAFDIMAEVRRSGIREQLGLPSVYCAPAVVDAVSDIKASWAILKNKIRTLVTANENLSADERMYLRTVLRLGSVYAAVLRHEEYEMPKNAAKLDIDAEHLNRLLCRLTRKHLARPEVRGTDYFSIEASGYAYRDGSLFIASRIPGKRLEIPLRDSNTCKRQIRLCIREGYAALALPVEVAVKKHDDYRNTVFVHIGYRDMFTLSNGNVYGQELGGMASAETRRLDEKNRKRARIRAEYRQSLEAGDREKARSIEGNNLGTAKYTRQKDKERAKTEAFINAEINRMLEAEKPARVVIARPLTIGRTKLPSKAANRNLARSFGGYIRERLSYKCLANSVELMEVNSRGTGSTCSNCGAEGRRLPEGFSCPACGYQASIAWNGARNIEGSYRKNCKDEE